MKKLILKSLITAILMGVAWQVHAMGEGFYIGVMFGPATSNGKIINAQVPSNLNPDGTFNSCGDGMLLVGTTNICVVPVKPRSQQFTTRIYMGNQFNQYAAIEFGLDFFGQIHYNFIGVQSSNSPSQRVRGIDLVGKGIWPLGAFSVYGKAGIAATYITTSTALNPAFKFVDPMVRSHPCNPNSPLTSPENAGCVAVFGQNGHRNKFSATASFGISYDINQSWQTDISANALFVGGDIGRVTSYTIGISYHFVNKYCGQFLCDD